MKKIAVFVLGLMLVACADQSSTNEASNAEPVKINQKNEKGERDGLFISKSPDGTLKYKMNYKDGKKHGEGLDYYESGELRAKIYYDEGLKDGEAIWYYDEKDKIFRINHYKQDILNGLQEKFYKNGNQLSQLEFRNGYPGVGLREWKDNGSERSLGNYIKVSKRGLNLYAEMNSGQSNVQFYYGELVEGKFLSEDLREISGANGVGQLPFEKIKDPNNIVITARYKTYLKNDRVVTTTVKWSEL